MAPLTLGRHVRVRFPTRSLCCVVGQNALLSQCHSTTKRINGSSKLSFPEKKIDESVGVPCYILAFCLVEAIAIILVWVLIIQKTRLISSINYNKRQGS